jgi:capsular polysaccharide biosynthesis protein
MAMPTPLPILAANPAEAPADQGRLAGRQLAEHPLLAARSDHERPGVADVLSDARPLLSTYGISFEILRTRPGMVVLRSRPTGRVSALVACELVKSLLAAVTDQVCSVKASVVENTCAQRGAPACLYSVVWEDQVAAPAGPGPSTDRPIDRGPDAAGWTIEARDEMPLPEWDRPVETDELPEWDRPIDALDDLELPEWDRPIDPLEAPPTNAIEPVQGRPANAARSPQEPAPSPPTAASSTAYQFQVSTPNALVVPNSNLPSPSLAPARVPAPIALPAVALPAVAAPMVSAPAVVTSRRRFPKGLVRRGWLLAIALVAGSAGGWFAGAHATATYGAQATLVVQSGAGKTGPGSANDALALATTYSALIPKDQSILSTAAGTLKIPESTIQRNITVTVQNGTSLLLLSYKAPTAAQAVAGADAVARAVTSTIPLSSAIAPGSVAIVSVPTLAGKQGMLHKYGIIIGGFIGLVVGLILVLAAERADPRIDDAVAMARAVGCRAAIVPSDLSFAELARVLSDAGREKGGLTIVPLAIADTAPTMQLARELRPCWPVDGPAVAISPSFSSGVVELTKASGPTVLISHPGTRLRDVVSAAERLRMMNRAPVWAVLANRRLRTRVSGRVG